MPCRFQQCWDRLPCRLSKGILKLDFLDICLTTSLAVSNLRNTYAMRVIFFLKGSNFDLYSKNGEKQNEKNFFES